MPVSVSAASVKAPPDRGPRASKAGTAKAATRQERADALTGFGQLAQLPLIAYKQYADAGAVGKYWPSVASEIAALAETQPEIAKVIDPLIKAGPYSGLIMALLPFALQIGVNHGRFTPGAGGTVPATVLDAQVQTAIAEQELAALRVQREAEEQARAMREEMAAEKRKMSDAMATVQTRVVP